MHPRYIFSLSRDGTHGYPPSRARVGTHRCELRAKRCIVRNNRRRRKKKRKCLLFVPLSSFTFPLKRSRTRRANAADTILRKLNRCSHARSRGKLRSVIKKKKKKLKIKEQLLFKYQTIEIFQIKIRSQGNSIRFFFLSKKNLSTTHKINSMEVQK